MSKAVYENEHYEVVVGIPPSTPDMPNPITAYLVINKETGVTESWHSVLFYVKQNADLFNDMLVNPPKKEDDKQAGEQRKYSFN